MQVSPVLALHIAAGTLGFLSGAVAMSLRKGSRLHSAVGRVFVVTMLIMSACGVYLAFMKSQPSNILGGAMTFYLVGTAWLTARHREGETGVLDWTALLAALSIAAVAIAYGLKAALSPTGLMYGIPAGLYFFPGTVALVAGVGDARMLWRGGVSGSQRLARHLWRMCFALFIAAGSIFLARQQLFPSVFRQTGALYLLTLAPLLAMIFWLVRLRLTTKFKKKSAPNAADGYSASLPSSSLQTRHVRGG